MALLCVAGHDGHSDLASVELLRIGSAVVADAAVPTAVPALPFGRSAIAAVALEPLTTDLSKAVGDAALVIGGCVGSEALTAVDALELRTHRWRSVAPLLEPRSALGAAAFRQTVVACGGFNGVSLQSAEAFDTSRGTWVHSPMMAEARCSFPVVELGGVFFAAGGSGADGMLSSVEMLDLRCGAWVPRSPMAQARSCFGAASFDDHSLVTVGGHDGRSTLDVVAIYDMRADRWQEAPPLSVARSAASVAKVGDTFWVVGGYDGKSTLAGCEALRASAGDALREHVMEVPRTGLAVLPLAENVPEVHDQGVGGMPLTRHPRIVSLSQAHTLMLYRLGAARHVAAIDTFGSQRPEGLCEVPRIDSFSPDPAAVRSLKPSAVVASFASQTKLLTAEAVGCPVLLLEAPKGDDVVGEICKQLHTVAELVSANDRAIELERSLRERLASIRRATAPIFGCSYFIELDCELYTSSDHAFLGYMFTRELGLHNVADAKAVLGGSEYFKYKVEDLLAADPHFYIVAHTGTARVDTDPQLAGLGAVKGGRVVHTPVHYDQVAWSLDLLDVVEGSARRMLQRRHSSPLPRLQEGSCAPMDPTRLAEALRETLSFDGIDLVTPFCVGWYNDFLMEMQSDWARSLKPLPDFRRASSCLAFVIGNTRSIWTPFTMWMRGESSRLELENPFDTFVHEAVNRACGALLRGVAYETYWSCEESADRMVAMQRVAEVAGMAQLDHSLHLSVHPTYGSWISLRAVVVCDLSGHELVRPKLVASLLSPEEKDEAAAALKRALSLHANPQKLCEDLHGEGMESCERSIDIWRKWIELRDVVKLGKEYRFADAQLEYHYTKNRSRLREAVLGSHHLATMPGHDMLLVAGGHDGRVDVASCELFAIDSDRRFSQVCAPPPMRASRGGCGMAVIGCDVYVLGGNEGDSPSDAVEAFSFASNTWRTCTSLSQPRMCPNAASGGESVFAFGGLIYEERSPVVLSTTEVYTPATDSWTRGPSLSEARCSCGSAALCNRIFAVGGFDRIAPLASMEVLDTREGRWSALAPLARARSCLALVALDEYQLLAIGGHVGNSAADAEYGPTKMCELYDVRKNAWLPGPALASAAVSPAAAVHRGSVFVIGGFDGMQTLGLCQSFRVDDLRVSCAGAEFCSNELLEVCRSGPVVAAFGGCA